MSTGRVIAICGLLAAVGPLSSSLFTPAMVILAEDLQTDLAAVQWTISIYFLGLALSQLICGPLSDRLGRRPVLAGYFLLYTLGSVIAFVADHVGILIFARFLQGVGSAAGIAISRAIIRDCFNGESQVRVQAMVALVLAVAPALAPTMGGVLIGIVSWRYLFLLMSVIGIWVLLTIRYSLIETNRRQSGAAKTALFASYGKLLRSKQFLYNAMILGGTNGTVYAQSTVLALVLIGDVGLSPSQFGMFLMVQTIMFLSTSFLVSRLIGRISGRKLLDIGMIFVVVSTLWFPAAYFWAAPSVASIIVPIALCGLAMGFAMPTATAKAMGPFPEDAGASAAVIGFIQMGSGVLGGFATSWIASPWPALVSVSTMMGAIGISSWILARRDDPSATKQ